MVCTIGMTTAYKSGQVPLFGGTSNAIVPAQKTGVLIQSSIGGYMMTDITMRFSQKNPILIHISSQTIAF